jgi:acyl carrier protein
MSKVSLRDLLAAVSCFPSSSDAELRLSSLQVVSLVERIEETFDVRLTSRDVTRKSFRTESDLADLLRMKGCDIQ